VLGLGNVLPQNVFWVNGNVSIEENINFSGIVMPLGNIVSKSGNRGILSLLSSNGSITLFNDDPNNPVYLFSLNKSTPRPIPCRTDELLEKALQDDPSLQQIIDLQLQNIRNYIDTNTTDFKQSPCTQFYTIPIVVHVVYDPGIPSGNISDAQIFDQITRLNVEFNGPNPSSTTMEDMCVQFCLAQISPSGSWPSGTPGITRTSSTLANHQTTTTGQLDLLSLISFPNNQYLNIWVVETIDNPSNILGYSPYPLVPSSLLDGVVILNKVFGDNLSNPPPFDEYELGMTLVHEVGHYLGLRHTFNPDGVCGSNTIPQCENDGDFICDTPPALSPTFSCPIPPISCPPDVAMI